MSSLTSESRILKFGGSSLGSPSRIAEVIKIFTSKERYKVGSIRGVVVSAMQGVTDELIQIASITAKRDGAYRERLTILTDSHLDVITQLIPPLHRSSSLASVKVLTNELSELLSGIFLIGECTPRTLDLVMSFGERLSALIVSEVCQALEIECSALDARSLLVTDSSFGSANVLKEVSYSKINDFFTTTSHLQIITGFIAADQSGATTTLGRGGSDYTASLFGAALEVGAIEIWTDVDGMLTADPRKVPKAIPIPHVTVDEAMELCHFGAKVIYPPTIQPAVDFNIPLLVKNTFSPDVIGTEISARPFELGQTQSGRESPVTGISSIQEIALIRIQGSGMIGVAGVAMRFFRALAQEKINVILITQASSEHTICCAILPHFVQRATQCVSEEFAYEISSRIILPLVVEEGFSIISVVGAAMKHSPGVAGRVFSSLGKNGVNVAAIAQGSSELNISTVVSTKDEVKALNALHDEFFLQGKKSVHIWLVGTGLIGSMLQKLIAEHRDELLASHDLDLQVAGVLNRSSMTINQVVSKDGDLNSFIAEIIKANLPSSLLVDCTASEELPLRYGELLERRIGVVTPNKKGLSGTLDHYTTIKQIAKSKRTPFLHETTVGAGLPILSTLGDLIKSGDTIIRIEAVLSGTMSYIFNELSESKPFSVVVRKAKELGLTEPDPRDDLSGKDIVRKVLILAREAGLALEESDVSLQNIIPESLMKLSTEEFMEQIVQLDPYFEALRNRSANKEERLFFSARIECDLSTIPHAHVTLSSHSSSHPFTSLAGSDNIVSFTTQRYATQPLVVKGPGAGSEVTAAGVLADIVRVAG